MYVQKDNINFGILWIGLQQNLLLAHKLKAWWMTFWSQILTIKQSQSAWGPSQKILPLRRWYFVVFEKGTRRQESYDLQQKPLHVEVKAEPVSVWCISIRAKICVRCGAADIKPKHNPEWGNVVTSVASKAILQNVAENFAPIPRKLRQANVAFAKMKKLTPSIVVLMMALAKLNWWWKV